MLRSPWNAAWVSLAIALQLLTRIPVTVPASAVEADYGRSVLAYPLVGLLLGGLLAAVAQVPTTLLPTLLHSALILTLWVALTGALHIDGVGDLADAWVGGHGDRERTLHILKDPLSGPMAVTAIVLLLLLKFAALSALLQQGAWQALLLAPVLGRAALVAAFLTLPYARSDGLGSSHSKWLPRRAATSLLLLTLLLTLLLMGWTGVAAVVAGAMVFLWLRHAALQRVGGLTGDIAGALCEGVEVASLIACVLLAGSAT